jgi:hypothetical protein
MAPQPTAEVPAAVTNEIQKQLSHQENDPEKPELSDEEAQKQDGVKRVEAITTVWTKQVLVVMFIL